MKSREREGNSGAKQAAEGGLCNATYNLVEEGSSLSLTRLGLAEDRAEGARAANYSSRKG